ncbi:uncharacterized protein LOC127284392 [Leptopilina boulardi]|uniref:uncharacterized protein LOC127284392 n=1 Tax=Leptopilina boulardi TaxID=63433 RepID=UPI0021F541D3|nr:uncharacterized protein LOC127284392 [Leptopilina boulardi]
MSKKSYRNELRKFKNESVDSFLDRQKCTSQVARTMIHMQLHKKYKPYSDSEKELAKHMMYHSTSAYKQLRKAGCNLPHEITVVRWISEVDIKPGLCDSMFKKVEECIEKLPNEERICALKMDEIHLKSYEEYSKGPDCIEGIVDLGPLGRLDERAKCAFLLCLDSLNATNRWRQILAYLLPGKSGMSGEQVK